MAVVVNGGMTTSHHHHHHMDQRSSLHSFWEHVDGYNDGKAKYDMVIIECLVLIK
jgi:hypothetical protein